MIKVNTIEEYIAQQAEASQAVIDKMRILIKECAPDAEEKISFRMPAYLIGKEVIVYFHTAKTHLGFYPLPEGIDAFKDKLINYKTAKGVVQFPYKNIPYDMIREIVLYRAEVVTNKQ